MENGIKNTVYFWYIFEVYAYKEPSALSSKFLDNVYNKIYVWIPNMLYIYNELMFEFYIFMSLLKSPYN